MQPDYILKADVIDIIFNNRNKDYGAYTLRKHYPERLYKAFLIMFILSASLSLILYFQKAEIITTVVYTDPFYGAVPPIEKEISKIPKDPGKPKLKKPTQFTDPPIHHKAVVNNNSGRIFFSKNADSIRFFDDPGIHGNTSSGGHLPLMPLKGLPGNDSSNRNNKTFPLSTADVMPAYPGGLSALQKFLAKNLVAPQTMERDGNGFCENQIHSWLRWSFKRF